MAFDSYANLKTALIEWSKREDALTVVDDCIDLCEAEMWQHLRIKEMDKRYTASTDGDRFLQLPDDVIEIRRLRLISGSETYDVEGVPAHNLIIRSAAGLPKFYTLTGEIEFDRTPDATYTVEAQYYKKLPALSSSNATNAVLTNYPNVYRHGCMWALREWSQEENLAQYHYGQFMSAINSINAADRRGRHSPGMRARKRGATP